MSEGGCGATTLVTLLVARVTLTGREGPLNQHEHQIIVPLVIKRTLMTNSDTDLIRGGHAIG